MDNAEAVGVLKTLSDLNDSSYIKEAVELSIKYLKAVESAQTGAQQLKVVICDNSPCEYCTRHGFQCDNCKDFSDFNGRRLTTI